MSVDRRENNRAPEALIRREIAEQQAGDKAAAAQPEGLKITTAEGRWRPLCETAVVREQILLLFADGAGRLCPAEELETAALFFGWLLKAARLQANPVTGDARWQMIR
jgi:hypothetical protein